MILDSLHVQNFRSILDQILACDKLTALVGANGSGKSSFLRALELFYAGSPKFDVEDFYNENTAEDIEITGTFVGLNPDEVERFASYVEGPKLTVVRVLSLKDGRPTAQFHGSLLLNRDFATIRAATTAADKKREYENLFSQGSFADLPKWVRQEQGLGALREWELKHPEKCERQRDAGQFFGFTEVAQGYLGKYTRFISIPAVRDAAAEAAEGRGSAITELMDLVVRSVLAERDDITKFRDKTQQRYDELMDPTKLQELQNLESQITGTLRTYVPDAAVSISWQKNAGIDIPMPKASVKLTEDGYPSSVARTGHGLQRAFILTMLQHLVLTGRAAPASALSSESASQVDANSPGEALPTPNLVLAIEEPGLYQHPNRQRHLSKILFALASGTIQGVARATQVIYCTHSPFFVGIDRFEQLRLLRKRRTNGSGPKTTSIARAQLDEIARLLWEAEGKPGAPFTAETLRPRLQSVMTPWVNEGFFAQVTVLVEGEDDRAAVLGAAAAQGHDFESLGISVIPCMGKNNLDRPAVIFRALDIPTYVIWDSDHHKSDAKPEDNKRLLKLLAKPEIEWPAFVSNDSACFETDLETTLREEIGAETFDSLLQNAQQEFGISSKDRALKNPIVVQRVMAGAQGQGKSSTTLKAMVERIVALRPAETTG